MLIGREKEIKVLNNLLVSAKAEMVAIIGRRRVGKTFLINSVYDKHIIFSLTGIRNASNAEQLKVFAQKLQLLTGEKKDTPADWIDAFFLLRKALESRLNKDKKIVLFFDELSWLAVPNSNFLDYLGYFWNDWAARQNIIVVLCGSASSWIIRKVINDKGGLHNRVTTYLHLKPFTLAETEQFLLSNHANFTRYQIVQMYMAFGGIPLYLEQIQREKSAIQNINDICFSATGLLKNEFNRLYPALFENATNHIAIVRALSQKQKGLSRSEIINLAKVPNGNSTTVALEELEQSDFIMAYHPYGKKKKGKLYRLIDEYSLFYLKFIENSVHEGEGTFMKLSQLQEFKIWTGYAYEGICMKHVLPIKIALGVSGVYTTTYSFLKKATSSESGLQIDMMLERADRVINLFEIKFYTSEFNFTKAFAEQLRKRIHLFTHLSKTRYQVRMVLITTFGLKKSKYNYHFGIADTVLTLDDLFLIPRR